MKKVVIKIVVLLAVFAGGIFIFSAILDKGNTGLTAMMGRATLPLIDMDVDGIRLNCLRGYTAEMDGNYMRDAITPLPADRKLTITVEDYGRQIDTISYEVRSIDTKRLVENTEVTGFNKKDGRVEAVLPIKDLMEQGQEYMLKIRLTSDGTEIDYYTRIIYEEDLNIKACVDFMRMFSDSTFQKEQAQDGIGKYLEPNSQGNNSDLHHVDIHSKLSQVTWGDLDISRISEPRISIKETSPTATSATLRYEAESRKENGEAERYQVTEFFRVRYTTDRIYLLDYDRTVNQKFIEENDNLMKQSIYLGIVDKEIEYKTNEKGDMISFVQAGELWHYNQGENKLSRVFSFNDGDDPRASYNQHGIKIIGVDEEGNADFLVYGYMNRGRHEGQTGVCVYHFSSVSNSVEEMAFITSRKSYQLLKEDMGRLSYVNKAGDLFLMMDGNLYRVNLQDGAYETLVSGLKDDCYKISKNNQFIAWQDDNDPARSVSLTVMNLDNNGKRRVEAGEGEYIRVLGFMETDLVYGLAKQGDLIADATGNVIFPSYRLVIVNKNNTVMKDKNYSESGVYVTGAVMKDQVINLSRIQMDADGGYTVVADESITYNAKEEKSEVLPTSFVSDTRQTVWQLSLLWPASESQPNILNPKEVLFEESREITIEETGESPEKYYVYGRGQLQSVYGAAGPAIRLADELMGVVVGDDQRYVWERGNRKLATQLSGIQAEGIEEGKSSLSVCLDAMLSQQGVYINSQELLNNGQGARTILQNQLDALAVDLTGCDVTETFYYVSNGSPVLAMVDQANAVLIVGYDEANVTYLNPNAGKLEKKGLKSSTEMFEAAGNVFISYVK